MTEAEKSQARLAVLNNSSRAAFGSLSGFELRIPDFPCAGSLSPVPAGFPAARGGRLDCRSPAGADVAIMRKPRYRLEFLLTAGKGSVRIADRKRPRRDDFDGAQGLLDVDRLVVVDRAVF